jgi:ankyrin repeat protein
MLIKHYANLLMLGLGLLAAMNVSGGSSNTPSDYKSLHQAVYAQDIEGIETLLLVGTDINQLGPSWYGDGAALHLAVRNGNLDIVKILVRHGAVIDIRDRSDHTPLHNAAWNGHVEIMEFLIDEGADIHATTYSGRTPLSCARSGRKTEAIQFIEGKLQLDSN